MWFYNNIHDALFMRTSHGFKFMDVKFEDINFHGFTPVFLTSKTEGLLVPRNGDLCEYYHKEIGWMFAKEGESGPLWKTADNKLISLPEESELIRIRSRNNNNFIWPTYES